MEQLKKLPDPSDFATAVPFEKSGKDDILEEIPFDSNPIKAQEFIEIDHSDNSMIVAIRIRPLNPKELLVNDFEIVTIQDKLLVVLDKKEVENESEGKKMDVLHRSKEQRFFFDRVLKDFSNAEVHAKSCSHLVEFILKGYNSTVFAYGTTVFLILGKRKNIHYGWHKGKSWHNGTYDTRHIQLHQTK